MITPVKLDSLNSRVNFGNESNLYSDFNSKKLLEETPKDSPVSGVKEKAKGVRNGFLNFLKGINDVTNTTQGFVRGVAEGAAATAVVGILGKSIKEAKGDIAGTIGNSLKYTGKCAKKAIGFIPKLITEAPIENLKSVITLPKRFYKDFLGKGNKLAAAAATVIGLGVLGFRTLQGKLFANKANSEIDHYTTPKGHKE